MRSVAIHSTGQIFMVFYSTISQNTHKMGKISNIHTFEILGHPNGHTLETFTNTHQVIVKFTWKTIC